MDMDFLASPPDVQMDWMSAMMQVLDDQSDFSQSPSPALCNLPISPSSQASSVILPSSTPPCAFSVPVAETYQFELEAEKPTPTSAMKEMVFRMAAMQPVHIDQESVKPPKRRNVRISKDPQSVAARHRRERISERIRILQRLVPGGTKMDTASMLDEAVQYLKFLKSQVTSLERAGFGQSINGLGLNTSSGHVLGFPGGTFFCSRRMEQAQDRCSCC